MFEKTVEAKEIVIKQGDENADYFYVVEKGVYHALLDQEDGSMKKVFEYKHEGNFGELALLYNMPRAATIQVISSHLPVCLFLFRQKPAALPGRWTAKHSGKLSSRALSKSAKCTSRS